MVNAVRPSTPCLGLLPVNKTSCYTDTHNKQIIRQGQTKSSCTPGTSCTSFHARAFLALFPFYSVWQTASAARILFSPKNENKNKTRSSCCLYLAMKWQGGAENVDRMGVKKSRSTMNISSCCEVYVNNIRCIRVFACVRTSVRPCVCGADS